MAYVRFVERFNPWAEWKPDVNKLLKSFDFSDGLSDESEKTVSLYQAADRHQIIESCAAYFQKLGRGKVEKFGAVVIQQKDLHGLSLQLEPIQENLLGIPPIDRLHYNISGSRRDFKELVKRITKAMLAGEERFLIVPGLMIAARLQLFLHLDASLIDKEAKNRCLKALDNPAAPTPSDPWNISVMGALSSDQSEIRLEAQIRNELDCLKDPVRRFWKNFWNLLNW